jgi:TrmH family RNA methyltransferase
MMLEEIRSGNNKSLKMLRKAANHREVCLIEGPKLFDEALKAELRLEFVLISEEMEQDYSSLLQRSEKVSGRLFKAPRRIFDKVAATVTSQGILALGENPAIHPAAEARSQLFNKPVILDAIQDPGNLGTLLRTALAFSASAAVLLPGCANPFNEKVIRASAGAVFHLPLVRATAEELQAAAESHDFQLVGLDAGAETELKACAAVRPAVIIGNEGHGFSEEIRPLIDYWVHIPSDPRSESLNAAVAGAIAIYQLFGRVGEGGYNG